MVNLGQILVRDSGVHRNRPQAECPTTSGSHLPLTPCITCRLTRTIPGRPLDIPRIRNGRRCSTYQTRSEGAYETRCDYGGPLNTPWVETGERESSGTTPVLRQSEPQQFPQWFYLGQPRAHGVESFPPDYVRLTGKVITGRVIQVERSPPGRNQSRCSSTYHWVSRPEQNS